MDDEFDKLLNLLSEDTEVKEKKLEVIFQRCSDFFEYYKKVMKAGTPVEKESVMLKMSTLREKLQAENVKVQQSLGMTREQLQEVACKPENFTKEQWEFLKAAENRISVEKEESKERAQKLKALRASELKGKVKNKQNRKSGWMKT